MGRRPALSLPAADPAPRATALGAGPRGISGRHQLRGLYVIAAGHGAYPGRGGGRTGRPGAVDLLLDAGHVRDDRAATDLDPTGRDRAGAAPEVTQRAGGRG